ncbi:HP0268 family nuclease [Campylobacter sp. MG1]|uniref:HP0268 family nuclease n=1 Tax=Campylobacter sp. MG1 TaxID=2976332 RepID=UPI00226D2FCB|nr:HP0268 family nuclease [Campylobacter sp. MG1]
MKFKLAKQTLNSKPKEVSLDDAIALLIKDKVVFLDNSNKEEEIQQLIQNLNEYKVYINKINFGLLEDEFIYEVHIL